MSRTLFREVALADGRSDRLRIGLSALVEDGRLAWLRPMDDEGELGAADGLEVVDASGGTIVPGMVDGHSHVTLPGGAHWIDRIDDGPERLLTVADRNGRLLTRSGVRWARDVGSPRYPDPADGSRSRALALGLRDRWRADPSRPHIVAAGTWLDRSGTLPPAAHTVVAETADELLANAVGQLDEGADFLKLYLDGPDVDASPWTAAEVERVTTMAHARGARVTAHATRLTGARAGVLGGVDSIEHGDELDAELCAEMARRGTFLVSTLSVFGSWRGFGTTTGVPRFTNDEFLKRLAERSEKARTSVGLAHRSGVRIAAGTDGGGSVRAGQLAGEVELLVAAGLEPWQALGAATWCGGELLGNDAGALWEGGPADFFLVHGDPLSDPAALWRVWRVAWEG
ncbi:MAG TPA: amidohydrolase family protein [Candidatus Limnocylindrales bacterium]|nr:amidohydrolase family protein [Candidatus Limnocylindrales bacterium]